MHWYCISVIKYVLKYFCSENWWATGPNTLRAPTPNCPAVHPGPAPPRGTSLLRRLIGVCVPQFVQYFQYQPSLNGTELLRRNNMEFGIWRSTSVSGSANYYCRALGLYLTYLLYRVDREEQNIHIKVLCKPFQEAAGYRHIGGGMSQHGGNE